MLQVRHSVPTLPLCMPMTPKHFRAALKRLGMNQTNAAKRLGVTPRAVRFWVAGDRSIPEPVVILLRTWMAASPKRGGAGRSQARPP